MLSALPPPDESGSRSSDSGNGSHGRGRADRALPSTDDLLHMILQIPGLLILGHLSPQKANITLRALHTALTAQRHRSHEANREQTSDELVEQCKQNPLLLNSISSMLTDEQLRYLMERIHHAPTR